MARTARRMNALETPAHSTEEWIRLTAFGFAVVAVLGAAIVLSLTIRVVVFQAWDWKEILTKFAAVIGLPGAAAVAFVLVVFLRQTDGPIEFEGLGFKFSGAAGQVIMWVICFLAIAGAIKLLY